MTVSPPMVRGHAPRPAKLLGAFVALALAFSPLAGPVAASDIFIYPNSGQDKAQQDRDRYECHSWAVGQTGFDPSRAGLDVPVPPAETDGRGRPLRGAVGGAALGVAVGAITGSDIGKSALIGGGAGLLGSGLKNRRDKKKAEQAYEADLTASQQHRTVKTADYDRAIGACLEGRDYTVK
ncbi:hypothetical protein [Kordiimonas gwangyangensis]|uniref:hypothetical protein n=1 Tax=Kordiimonas gwangyangensis TaxID=288022 RepID=UPI0003A9F09E|nr:hypothetical protein [Kordiimonas gwangyangensis]